GAASAWRTMRIRIAEPTIVWLRGPLPVRLPSGVDKSPAVPQASSEAGDGGSRSTWLRSRAAVTSVDGTVAVSRTALWSDLRQVVRAVLCGLGRSGRIDQDVWLIFSNHGDLAQVAMLIKWKFETERLHHVFERRGRPSVCEPLPSVVEIVDGVIETACRRCDILTITPVAHTDFCGRAAGVSENRRQHWRPHEVSLESHSRSSETGQHLGLGPESSVVRELRVHRRGPRAEAAEDLGAAERDATRVHARRHRAIA